jgi:hypothetical protein
MLGGVLVAVAGPALLVGRVSAELMALPGEPAPRTQAATAWAAPLAICACVVAGGVGSLYVPGRPWVGGAVVGIAPGALRMRLAVVDDRTASRTSTAWPAEVDSAVEDAAHRGAPCRWSGWTATPPQPWSCGPTTH